MHLLGKEDAFDVPGLSASCRHACQGRLNKME
jgi:hypothetical protein